MRRLVWVLCVAGLIAAWPAASGATDHRVRLAPAPGYEWMPGERWFARWERPKKEVLVVVVVQQPYIVPTHPYPDTTRQLDAQIQRLGELIREEERAEENKATRPQKPSGE